MRIGIVAKHLNHPVGFGTYSRRVLDAMATLAPDDEFRVVVPERVARADWPENVTIELVRWPISRWPHIRWERTVAALMAARRADVVHYLHWGAPAVPQRRPLVVNVFDAIEWLLAPYRQNERKRRLDRSAVRRADRIITLSEYAKADVLELFDLPREKVVVTHLGGPDITAGAGERRAFWLFLGGTERRKNLRLVLTALAGKSAAGMKLKVVGPALSHPFFEDRDELLAVLGPERRADVEWLGEVAADQLARLYAEATGLIFPSRYEGFGLPAVEAMAHGTPVIAANASALPEVLGDAAVLVDPDDPRALGDAMARVAADKGLRRALAARGVEVARRYTWRATAERTLAVYEELARQ